MSLHSWEFSLEELVELLNPCMGATLGETDAIGLFDHYARNPKMTGIAGQILQQSILGLPQDSRQEADISVDGLPVELKATGLRRSKGTQGEYEAKEPMSITGVSVNQIVDQEFFDSFFWHKIERLLVAYYLYDSDKTVTAGEYSRFPWMGWEIHEFDERETDILKHDWTVVRDFIRWIQENYDDPEEGYPRLSSELRGELMYIDTAPKWPNKPRFRLKRSVVTAMAQRIFEGTEHDIVPLPSMNAVDRRCRTISFRHEGKTVRELADELGVEGNRNSKSIAEAIVTRMFGSSARKMSNVEPFASAGIDFKTATVTRRGTRTEDTKLCRVDFDEVLDPHRPFEDSAFYAQFAERQMLFAIFEEPDRDAPLSSNVFLGFKRIAFDDEFIREEVLRTWEDLRRTIFSGRLEEVFEYDRHGNVKRGPSTGEPVSAPNFPKSQDHDVFLRGTGADARSKTLVINGVRMYRQWNIWIKGRVLCEMLADLPFL